MTDNGASVIGSRTSPETNNLQRTGTSSSCILPVPVLYCPFSKKNRGQYPYISPQLSRPVYYSVDMERPAVPIRPRRSPVGEEIRLSPVRTHVLYTSMSVCTFLF